MAVNRNSITSWPWCTALRIVRWSVEPFPSTAFSRFFVHPEIYLFSSSQICLQNYLIYQWAPFLWHIHLPPLVSTMTKYFQRDYFCMYQVLDLSVLWWFRRRVSAMCIFLVIYWMQNSKLSYLYYITNIQWTGSLVFVLLHGFDDCGPPTIIPGWNILPLLTIVSPDHPQPIEAAGYIDISRGRSISQEERSLSAILRIPRINLPQSVSKLCPFRNGSFTLWSYIFQRLSKRFLLVRR